MLAISIKIYSYQKSKGNYSLFLIFVADDMGAEVNAIEDIIMVNWFYTNKQHLILSLFCKCNVPTVTTSRESGSNAQKKIFL